MHVIAFSSQLYQMLFHNPRSIYIHPDHSGSSSLERSNKCTLTASGGARHFFNQGIARAIIQTTSAGAVYAPNKFSAGQKFWQGNDQGKGFFTRAFALACPGVVPPLPMIKKNYDLISDTFISSFVCLELLLNCISKVFYMLKLQPH